MSLYHNNARGGVFLLLFPFIIFFTVLSMTLNCFKDKGQSGSFCTKTGMWPAPVNGGRIERIEYTTQRVWQI